MRSPRRAPLRAAAGTAGAFAYSDVHFAFPARGAISQVARGCALHEGPALAGNRNRRLSREAARCLFRAHRRPTRPLVVSASLH